MTTQAESYYQQGLTHLEQHHWQEANHCFQQALQLQANFPQAEAALRQAQEKLPPESTIQPNIPARQTNRWWLWVSGGMTFCLIMAFIFTYPLNLPQQPPPTKTVHLPAATTPAVLAEAVLWVHGEKLAQPLYLLQTQTTVTITVQLYDRQGNMIPPTAASYHWVVYPTLPNQTIRQDANGMVYYELPSNLSQQLITVVVESRNPSHLVGAVTRSLIITQ